MSIINPGIININYKKFDSDPLAEVVVMLQMVNSSNITFNQVPSWVIISDYTIISLTEASFKVKLDTSVANNLTPGDFSATIGITGLYGVQVPLPYSEGSVQVNLTLTDTQILQVTPSDLSFTVDPSVGAITPKTVQVVSENDWTITKDQSWILLSVTQGTGADNFTVNIDYSGLAVGTHVGVVSVDDGSTIKTVAVTVNITDGNSESDYLYVTPSEIEFIRNIGSAFQTDKTVNISSSATWNATYTVAAWLSLDKITGSQGSEAIVLSTDINGLIKGIYTSEITITHGNFVRKVFVTLIVNDIILEVPADNGVYFAEDEEEIKISTNNLNSLLQVDFVAVVNSLNTLYKKRVPFFKGEATANIGSETASLISSDYSGFAFATGIYSFIKPVNISFTAVEKDYFTPAVFETVLGSNLYFFNGLSPVVANKTNYLPNTITVSKDAVIAISRLSNILPVDITITGAAEATILNTLVNATELYTAIVNLSDYDLKDLDVIAISFLGQTLNVRIVEQATESTLLVFENEWQAPEIFEFTGELSIVRSADFTTEKVAVGSKVKENLLSAAPGTNFSIITGFLDTQTIAYLEKIFDSQQFYIYLSGVLTEVIPTFKTMEVYKTRKHLNSYKLTFKKALV